MNTHFSPEPHDPRGGHSCRRCSDALVIPWRWTKQLTTVAACGTVLLAVLASVALTQQQPAEPAKEGAAQEKTAPQEPPAGPALKGKKGGGATAGSVTFNRPHQAESRQAVLQQHD